MTSIVQPALIERPSRHIGGSFVQPGFAWLPSLVDGMGRQTNITIGAVNGRPRIGSDVGLPYEWWDECSSWRAYGAGLGSDGTDIDYGAKKTVCSIQGPDYELSLMGANGDGAIYRRAIGGASWTRITNTYFGETQDGGSTNPRRAGGRLIAFQGAASIRAFVACRKAGGNMGIARSADSGLTFTDWAMASNRNFTALGTSPQWAVVYGSADGRGTAGTDGVFILSNVTGATATVTRIDNQGVGAPTLADVRDVRVVREGTTETLFVVVGNQAGSDPDRGLWRCRITQDPTGGGFNPATHITWAQVRQCAASDRPNTIALYKPNGDSVGPIEGWLVYFASNTNAGGSYVLTADAGGATVDYVTIVERSSNLDDGVPTWTPITGASNINTTVYNRRRPHVLTFSGEPSAEKSILGGPQSPMTDAAFQVTPTGTRLWVSGKSTPWVCDNPRAATPIWRPAGTGLGALESVYGGDYLPGSTKYATVDDDRGLYTFQGFMDASPTWVISDDTNGIPGTEQQCRMVAFAADGTDDLFVARDNSGNGQAWRVDNGFDYATATATNIGGFTGPGACIGHFQYIDSGAVTRTLAVTSQRIYRNGVNVHSFTSSAVRAEFIQAGATLWVHVSGYGIIRSTDDGATWALWWDKAFTASNKPRYMGHFAQDRDDPNTLYITFDDGGLWKCASAHTAAAGSGSGGSVPAGATRMSGGSLSTSTVVSAVGVDPVRGHLYVSEVPLTGGVARMHMLPYGGSTFITIEDTEYRESALIPIHLTVYDGLMLLACAGPGMIRRLQ